MKKILIGALLLFSLLCIKNYLTIKTLHAEASQMKADINYLKRNMNKSHQHRTNQRLAVQGSTIKPSSGKQELNSCDFHNAKYLVNEIGYLNFNVTKENRITCKGKLNSISVNGLVNIDKNILSIKQKNISIELDLSTGCSRITGFMTLQQKDETWEIFELDFIKV